jgi:MFS family permease
MYPTTSFITISDRCSKALGYQIPAALGNLLGPLIGGSLAKPAEQFPHIFGRMLLFKEYPYFLPCAIAAAFCALSCLVAWWGLKETRPRTRGEGEPQSVPSMDSTPAEERPLPTRALLIRSVRPCLSSL